MSCPWIRPATLPEPPSCRAHSSSPRGFGGLTPGALTRPPPLEVARRPYFSIFVLPASRGSLAKTSALRPRPRVSPFASPLFPPEAGAPDSWFLSDWGGPRGDWPGAAFPPRRSCKETKGGANSSPAHPPECARTLGALVPGVALPSGWAEPGLHPAARSSRSRACAQPPPEPEGRGDVEKPALGALGSGRGNGRALYLFLR